MNKYFFLLLILLASCKNAKKPNANALNGKYEIQKAIVETQTDLFGISTTNTQLLFDDFGNKHKQITNNKTNISGENFETTTYTLINDEYIYTWESDKKNGTKISLKDNENDILANRFNFKKVDEDFRKKYQLQELGKEIIAGKKCTVYTLQIDKSKIKYFIWKNIPLSFELEMDNKKILSKLINLEENPSFSKSEFDVPKDIIFEEMSLDKEHTP